MEMSEAIEFARVTHSNAGVAVVPAEKIVGIDRYPILSTWLEKRSNAKD
jgi:hypothetical protein